MKVIGLTGGIGSGKTTVANFFKDLGVPIYIADERAKFILGNNHEVINEVKGLLGEDAYVISKDVEIPDRAFIAQKVFNDKQLLKSLNDIIHPKVRDDFEEFLKNQEYPYVIYEAAILLESGGGALCDHIILVTAPLKERIQRVMNRDQITEKQVVERINNQWDQRKKLEYVDLVLENINKEHTQSFVEDIHQYLLN